MDALKGKVEEAQRALALAVARANLTGDPMGEVIEAVSLSLGAQLALYQANASHFYDVGDRLETAVADAILRGGQGLGARRFAIVESLVPELAKLTAESVRSRNRTVTFKTALGFGGMAVALALGVGMAGYGAGWSSGHEFSARASGAVMTALWQKGSDAEVALVGMVRDNDLAAAWKSCKASAYATRSGRKACVMPMWLEGEPPPGAGK